MTVARFTAAVLPLSAGIVVWALHFAALYSATALACARGLPQLVAPAIASATALAVAALAVMIVRAWRRRDVFEQWLAATLAALALVAVAWEALPVLMVKPCA